MTNLAYHITGKDCLPDGRPIPAVGETLRHEGGAIKLFEAGLHWSSNPMDAWQHGPRLPDGLLHLVSYGGETIIGHDRGVSTDRTILASVDLRKVCQLFAWKLATEVTALSQHPRRIPAKIEDYLRTYDEGLLEAAENEVKKMLEADKDDCSPSGHGDLMWADGVRRHYQWASLLDLAIRRDLPINHMIDNGLDIATSAMMEGVPSGFENGKRNQFYDQRSYLWDQAASRYRKSCRDWFHWAANTALLYAQIGIGRDGKAVDTRSVM